MRFLPAGSKPGAEDGVFDFGSDSYSAGYVGPTAVTKLDFGGGYKMGSLIAKLDPDLVGGPNSGLVTSRTGLGDLSFAGGRGNVKFYGQANNGIVFTDADDADVYLATNAATQNFLGARIKYDLTGDFTLGARLSVSAAYNRSDLYTGIDDDDAGCNEDDRDQYFCGRDANVFLRHATYGKITAGLGETAFAGIGGINLGGTYFVTNNDPTLKAGGLEAPETFRRFEEIAPDVTGVERGTLVRYDSPTIAGFVLSASWGEANHVGAPRGSDDYWDVALRYAGQFGGIRVAGGIGYQDYDREGDDESQSNVALSGSIQHVPTGLYASGSYNNLSRDADFDPGLDETDDANAWYVQAGISQKWTSLGKTTLYTEYGETKSGAEGGAYWIDDSKTRNFGVGVVQNFDNISKSAYASYNNVDGEVFGDSGDVNVFMLGLRGKF